MCPSVSVRTTSYLPTKLLSHYCDWKGSSCSTINCCMGREPSSLWLHPPPRWVGLMLWLCLWPSMEGTAAHPTWGCAALSPSHTCPSQFYGAPHVKKKKKMKKLTFQYLWSLMILGSKNITAEYSRANQGLSVTSSLKLPKASFLNSTGISALSQSCS